MGKLSAQELVGTVRKIQDKQNTLSKNRFIKGPRIPFLIGRESSNPLDYIAFWINPSQCSWKVGLRSTIEKVAGGAIHHEWPTVGIGSQEADSLLDNPILSFTFQSGAIYPGAHTEIGPEGDKFNLLSALELPVGLGNFYDFLGILGQSNLLPGGKPNYVNILYTSNLFPALWLQGFFTEEGVNWDDSADNPNQVGNWGASFMVFNSHPALSTTNELKTLFTTFGFQSFGK